MPDFNFWAALTTKNGFQAEEVISALQKSIRRGKEEDACEFAYELYISSPVFLEKLWRRLLTISVEDIGFGNLKAPAILHSLNEIRKEFPYDDGDQPIFFIHAIRVLCQSQKDRSSDLLKNIIIKGFAMGKLPEIPDIALDKHTRKGVEMGRGSKHFFEEASLVFPQIDVENNYRERYGKILDEYDPAKARPDAFKFNNTQY